MRFISITKLSIVVSEVLQIRPWVESLPKVELHLHLEGAIPPDALWTLISKYGGDLTVPTKEDLAAKFNYRDFADFIDVWIWKNNYLREYEDFTFIAEAMARDLRAQNILYAESFFSPSRFSQYGLTTQGLAVAIRQGFSRVPEIKLRLIADLVRDHGPIRGKNTFLEVLEIQKEAGVVGIGIGGSEHLYPPAPFADVYSQARKVGLHTSAHAGEAAGADSVYEAITALNIERVGHAIRAEEKPSVIDLILEKDVALEICPLSNLATGVVKEIDKHPVRRYWERGLKITINTDDPHMFGNSMADELVLLHEKFGFTFKEIRQTIANAIDASWQSDEDKEQLLFSCMDYDSWSSI